MKYIGDGVNTRLNDMKTEKSFIQRNKRGKRKRICNVFRTRDTVGLPYMTVFLPVSYHICYEKFYNQMSFSLQFPTLIRRQQSIDILLAGFNTLSFTTPTSTFYRNWNEKITTEYWTESWFSNFHYISQNTSIQHDFVF